MNFDKNTISLLRKTMTLSEIKQYLGISEYRLRKALEEYDMVNKRKNQSDLPALTEMQIAIINGGLLGDASISPSTKKNLNCIFSITQAKRRCQFLQWVFEELQPYSNSLLPRDGVNLIHEGRTLIAYGKTEKSQLIYRSLQNEKFTKLRNVWYPENVKIVPTGIILDSLVVAVWFACDGQNVPTRKSAYFHTQSFSESDCDILIASLRANGFDCRISYERRFDRKPIIRINTPSYFDFINWIKPHFTWECFKYKVRMC